MLLKFVTGVEQLCAENTSLHTLNIIEMNMGLVPLQVIASRKLFSAVVNPTKKHGEFWFGSEAWLKDFKAFYR